MDIAKSWLPELSNIALKATLCAFSTEVGSGFYAIHVIHTSSTGSQFRIRWGSYGSP
ncbi:protein of unknown function [Agreia sp. COWG]|nr:protein of unknown function [Agreia sp. COWG]